MSEQNCVFAYDDYFCRECVGDGVPQEEVIPVHLFDVVTEYPTCAKCGKVHSYMVLDEDAPPPAPPVPDQLESLLKIHETLLRLDGLLARNIAALEQHTAAIERQTEVLSRPNVLG